MRPVTLNLAVLVRDPVNDNPWPGVDEVIEFNDTTCPAVDDETTKYLVEQVFVVMGYDSNQGDSVPAPAGWQIFSMEEARELIPGWAADELEFHAATKITCSNDPDNFYVVGDSFFDVLNAFNSCCGTPTIPTQALTFKISNTPLEPGVEYACGTAAAFRWLAVFGSENPGDGTYQFAMTLYDQAQNPANTKTFEISTLDPFTETEQVQLNWPADFIGLIAQDGTVLVANDTPVLGPNDKRVLDYDFGAVAISVSIFNSAAEQIESSQTIAALPGTQCGSGCISPYPEGFALTDGIEGIPYNQFRQLAGDGPYSLNVVSKPAWMTITFNNLTGEMSFTGTPDADGPASVTLAVDNCGQTPGDPITMNFEILPLVVFPLNNFADDLVPGLPFGVFEEDETFVGNATTMQEAADLWNNHPAWSLIATAYPIPGNNSALGLVMITADPLPDVRAMRYWSIDALSGTPEIYLSPDTLVRRANGVQVKSDVAGTLGNYLQFGINASTYGVGGSIPLVDITSPYYRLTLTAGTNYIYHNEDGEWAWCDVFGGFANNAGNLPPTVRFLAIQSFGQNGNIRNLALSNFANYLTAVANVEGVSFNGQPCQYNAAWIAPMTALKTWQMIDTAATLRQLNTLGLSGAQTPNLAWIGFRRNNAGTFLTQDDAWWENLPWMEKGIDMVGAQLEPSANVDGAFNGLGTPGSGSQDGITPEANARITLQSQNAARTSASDTAVANLTSLGFTIG